MSEEPLTVITIDRSRTRRTWAVWTNHHYGGGHTTGRGNARYFPEFEAAWLHATALNNLPKPTHMRLTPVAEHALIDLKEAWDRAVTQ